MKVLISDNLSSVGIDYFKQTPDIEVDVNTGLSPEALKEIIGQYDALVIRSATKVTEDLIAAADNLKVIGRAGIGLDNVDIPAASQRGIVVMNTPDGNTVTTAEHTIAMIMSLSRNIPQATESLKDGRWDKKKLQGRELFNKTLGIIGAGHIGKIVADRAKGLRMKVIIYDPYLKPETVEQLAVESVGFEELLARADIISIHVPRTNETLNLIDAKAMAAMKPGTLLVNCARGGIVNEDDLFDALSSGHLAGAALDVFCTEPPGEHRLMTLPNFICTPHLGASTREAQDTVARDVAEQITAYLTEGAVKNAVNVPSVDAQLMDVLKPYVLLAEKLGMVQAQLAAGAILEAEIACLGQMTQYDLTPLTTAMLKGLLTPILKDDVNFVNAPVIARDRGIKVSESRSETSPDFASLIKVAVRTDKGESVVSGTVFGGGRLPRLVRINRFYFEAVPEGHNLLVVSEDSPGVIGIITGLLGKHGVNISRMQVAEKNGDNQNIALLATSIRAEDAVLKEIRNQPQVASVQRIDL